MLLNTCAEPEVNQFQLHVLINNDVLELDIPMGNAFLVEIFESACQLLDDRLALQLTKLLIRLLLEAMTEGYPRQVLHDNVEMVIRLDHVINLDDVRMVHYLQYFDFSFYGALPDCLFDFIFLIGLYRYLLVFWLVDSHSDRSVRPLADDLTDYVILFEFGCEVSLLRVQDLILFVELVAAGQAGEQFIVVALHFEKFSVCEIPGEWGGLIVKRKMLDLVGIVIFLLFCLDSLLFLGLVEELIEILFGH